MKNIKIDLIAGARPNFIKIAPIINALESNNSERIKFNYRLIHTGQHYDKNMSETFFNQLKIPKPHINLGCGGGSHAEQTAKIMVAYESLLRKAPTEFCLVVGDVNSTLACAIVAKKMKSKVIHVEAGIRSLDLNMPEEINRIVTDSITDYFFTTSENANLNLKNNGILDENIFFVGNTMIDTLLKFRKNFAKPQFWDAFGLENNNYLVVTLHRPANVDEQYSFKLLVNEIIANSNGLKIIFPVHPRTKKHIDQINPMSQDIYFVEPLSYLEFNYLVDNARAVITDSGGITEEATVMNIPCMTLRDNTERPETVELGTNELLGTRPESIAPALNKLFTEGWKSGSVPELWDGKTSLRILRHLIEICDN